MSHPAFLPQEEQNQIEEVVTQVTVRRKSGHHHGYVARRKLDDGVDVGAVLSRDAKVLGHMASANAHYCRTEDDEGTQYYAVEVSSLDFPANKIVGPHLPLVEAPPTTVEEEVVFPQTLEVEEAPSLKEANEQHEAETPAVEAPQEGQKRTRRKH